MAKLEKDIKVKLNVEFEGLDEIKRKIEEATAKLRGPIPRMVEIGAPVIITPYSAEEYLLKRVTELENENAELKIKLEKKSLDECSHPIHSMAYTCGINRKVLDREYFLNFENEDKKKFKVGDMVLCIKENEVTKLGGSVEKDRVYKVCSVSFFGEIAFIGLEGEKAGEKIYNENLFKKIKILD